VLLRQCNVELVQFV